VAGTRDDEAGGRERGDPSDPGAGAPTVQLELEVGAQADRPPAAFRPFVRRPNRPFALQLEVAHLDVGDLVGAEVHLGHLREAEVQELGAIEAADLGVEVELLDDVTGVCV
jgi:hypothetical protein